ncbi:MAG: hypothetical protein WAK62_04335 [Terriglobales bacterium]
MAYRTITWCDNTRAALYIQIQGERRSMEMQPAGQFGGEHNELLDEARRLRRLQVMMSMVMSVIGQDPDLTLEEAAEISANARRAALSMFPDKELAYDILYRPRLQRLMNERFRLQ